MSVLQVGFVPKSFSIPVVAIHSMSQLPQRISIVCSESGGSRYDSQLVLPARMTFLVNACISQRAESRTYEQLLNGDTDLNKEDSITKIKVADAQAGSVSVWGFAVARTAESNLQLVGIEFAEWDPIAEFLLD